LRQAYCVASAHCLIVLDDLDLPLGKVRLRPHGSSGGHHGMESIITKTLTTQYPRLRIGIGRPANRDDVIDFVLTPFHPTERDAANAAIDLSVVTIECWLRDGFQAAMQALAGDNAKPVLAATDNEPAGSTHDKRH
jgi:PTH1 family peptidyl-tRNA hydrolase